MMGRNMHRFYLTLNLLRAKTASRSFRYALNRLRHRCHEISFVSLLTPNAEGSGAR
jgi:hypothetical protein